MSDSGDCSYSSDSQSSWSADESTHSSDWSYSSLSADSDWTLSQSSDSDNESESLHDGDGAH